MKILKEILNSDKIQRIICVYPGRFQPFCNHHYRIYQHLCNEFGVDNVIVAISNNEIDTDRNPLDIELRKEICRRYGVRHVVPVISPYRPIEVTKNYDPNSTALILAVGEKDFNPKMCDENLFGTKYYVKYPQEMVSFHSKGFLYVIPQITNNHIIASATVVRDHLKKSFSNCKEVFPWYDEELCKKIYAKLKKQSSTPFQKRILHIWEQDITFIQLEHLINDLVQGKIRNVTEKIDGQQLLFSVRDGRVVYAKTQSGISNPQNSEEFLKKIDIAAFNVYSNVCSEIESILRFIDCEYFFDNGKNFINVEIVDPSLINVISYGNQPYIILHNFLSGSDDLIHEFYGETKVLFSAYTLLLPRKIVLSGIYNCNKISELYTSEIRKLMVLENLNGQSSIRNLNDSGRKELEFIITRLGNLVLDEIDTHLCKVKFSCIQKIRQEIEISTNQANSNDEKKKKISNLMNMFQSTGGLDAVRCIEGIVFDYLGKQMKLTGSFRYINQIIALNKYSR